MITRTEAVARADAFLKSQGSNQLAYAMGARVNPIQELWVIEPRDPEPSAGEILVGGSLLVVPFDGPVHAIDGHGSVELIGLQWPAETAGLPADWSNVLYDYLEAFDWWSHIDWLRAERAHARVYPDDDDVFNAFRRTSFEDVRVVILGQDPYPRLGQAHGLAFSVPLGVRKPQALINIHRLLKAEFPEVEPPSHGNLESWADQGVLLLNTALTVRHEDEGSHLNAWERVTDAVIQALGEREEPIVFMLWGGPARKKRHLIGAHHLPIEAAHPTSYATAKDPFFESQSFRRAEAVLNGSIKWG